MVVTDVNPEVSKDESEVQSRRKEDPMRVIFGAKIEHDTTCMQFRKKSCMISHSPRSVSTRCKGTRMAMTSSWRARDVVPRRSTGVASPMSGV